MRPSEFASAAAPPSLHVELDAFNRERLAPSHGAVDWERTLRRAHEMSRRECAWIDRERASIASDLHDVPTDPDAFVAWFESLAMWGPGQGDPLFPWLATSATRDQMRWFLFQELAGEAGFDDLVALSQLKLPAVPKLEMARNYWDEMGRGTEIAMHGPMLERLADELVLGDVGGAPVWESLALANLMMALASHRHLAYQSIGALGAIELTAPGRCEHVNAGLVRLGIRGHTRKYYAVHATIDVKHSAAWNREVLRPLVAGDATLARPLAEGALLRLHAGARCFARYRRELGLAAVSAAAARPARTATKDEHTITATGLSIAVPIRITHDPRARITGFVLPSGGAGGTGFGREP